MSKQLNILKVIIVLALFCCCPAFGQSAAKQEADSAVRKLGKEFSSNTAKVNGTTLHYLRGGTGPAVILLHGFPQDWYEFHKIMPRLAKKFTVIAVDSRGIGGSLATGKGYEAANLAEDINQLAEQLKLEKPYIVGHDMGGMVAYAFARLYPARTRGVMLLEAFVPGIEPWDTVKSNPLFWHINFHQIPELPEKLTAGRQLVYFKHFFNIGTFNKKAITETDAAHYADAYASAAQLRAGFENYRALPANEKFNAAQTNSLELPLVLVGGDHSFGEMIPKIAADLRKHGCQNVSTEIIKNSSHYAPDEQPKSVAELIERYASMK